MDYCGDEQVSDYEAIIDRADKAAYEEKHSGRNAVAVNEENQKHALYAAPKAKVQPKSLMMPFSF